MSLEDLYLSKVSPSIILKHFHPKVHSRKSPPTIVPAKFSQHGSPTTSRGNAEKCEQVVLHATSTSTFQSQICESAHKVHQLMFQHLSTAGKGKHKRNMGRDALPKLSMIHPFRWLTGVIRGEESHSICVLVLFGMFSLERDGGRNNNINQVGHCPLTYIFPN